MDSYNPIQKGVFYNPEGKAIDVPREVIFKIFKLLSPQEQMKAARVSKMWLLMLGMLNPPLQGQNIKILNIFFFRATNTQKLREGMNPTIPPQLSLVNIAISSTQSFLHSPAVKEIAQERYKLQQILLKKDKDPVIDKCLEKIIENELQYSQTHFSVFHAMSRESFLLSFATRRLLMLANMQSGKSQQGENQLIEQTHWARFPLEKAEDHPQNLTELFAKHPMPSDKNVRYDHDPDVRRFLVAANAYVFANFSVDGESTWVFYLENKSVSPPDAKVYFDLLCDRFKLLPNPEQREQFLPRFKDLVLGEISRGCVSWLNKERPNLAEIEHWTHLHYGVITQIFIPHSLVDQVAYPCIQYGIRDKARSTRPLSELMVAIQKEPWKYNDVQIRLLASSLLNFNNGVRVFNHGYEDFFQTEKGQELVHKLDEFFMDMVIATLTSEDESKKYA